MRRTLLVIITLFSVLIILSTEAASLYNALHRIPLILFWAVALLVTLGAGIKTHAFPSLTLAQARTRAFWRYATSSPFRFILVLALIVFIAAIGLVAISAAPNNYDSLTYHMGRVGHWVQNGSNAVYPTIIGRQYEYPPFAEYAIAQLQILSGGDILANLPQFGAYIGCIVLAGMIAQALGLNADGQVVAGVTVAAIPMAVMEASSTQNDLVNAFWIMSALYWVLVSDALSLRTGALLVGTSLAIGTFVKFPAPFYAFPILVWFLARAVRRFGIRQTLVNAVTIMAVLLVLIQGTHYAHRAVLAVQGATQAPINGRGIVIREELSFRYLNRKLDAPIIVSNIVRNAGNHLALPIPGWNAAVSQLIVALHNSLRISVNDPAATYGYWVGVRFVLHEDYVGNFLHLLLALGAIVWTVLGRDAARQRWREYAAVVVAGICIFILVLKWQPWHSRLQTPWFVMTAPLISLFLLTLLRRWGALLAALALLVCALPWLFWGIPRPLLGPFSVLRAPRSSQYFATNPQLEAPYRAVIGYIQRRDCDRVGLVWGGNDMEYPLFPLLQQALARPVRIEHVNVVNISQFTESAYPPFDPCVIIGSYSKEIVKQSEIIHHGIRYVRTKTWNPLIVYEKAPP